MSIFRKSKMAKLQDEVIEEKEVYKDLGERMELKSYISFDDVRKHLVEMIEDNKKLRDEVDTLKKERFEGLERERKRAELAQISASEYKSQLGEAKKKIEKLEAEIQRQKSEIEMLEKEKNFALSEIEMMRIEGKEPKGEQEEPVRKIGRKKEDE